MGLGVGVANAGQDDDARRQQSGGHGDGLIGGVILGERQYTLAVRRDQARIAHHRRLAGVGHDQGWVGAELLEPHPRQTILAALNHHESQSQTVEAMAHQSAGLAGARDDIEGLAQAIDAPGESCLPQGILEGALLNQRQDVHQRIRPADHRQIDGHGHPDALSRGIGLRDLAETNGGAGITHHIEGIEQAHRRGGIPIAVDARDQAQADRAEGVDRDQQDERKAHPAHDEVEDVGEATGSLQPGTAGGHRCLSGVSARSR